MMIIFSPAKCGNPANGQIEWNDSSYGNIINIILSIDHIILVRVVRLPTIRNEQMKNTNEIAGRRFLALGFAIKISFAQVDCRYSVGIILVLA